MKKWELLQIDALDAFERKDYPGAVTLLEEMVSLGSADVGADHKEILDARDFAASILVLHGDHDAGERAYLNLLADRERIFGADAPELARTLDHLGTLYKARGKHAELKALEARSQAVLRRMMGIAAPRPAQPGDEERLRRAVTDAETEHGPEHAAVALALRDLGSWLGEQGRPDEAEPLLQLALAVSERVSGATGSAITPLLDALAGLYYKNDRPAEAAPYHERHLEITLGHLAPDQVLAKETDLTRHLTSLVMLTQVDIRLGRYRQVQRIVELFLTTLDAAMGDDNPFRPMLVSVLLPIYIARAEYRRAEEIIHGLMQQMDSLGDGGAASHPASIGLYGQLAAIALLDHRYDEAQQVARQALEVGRKALGDDHPAMGSLHGVEGEVLRLRRQLPEARVRLEHALALLEKLGPASAGIVEVSTSLGRTLAALGDPAAALVVLEKGLAAGEQLVGPESPTVGRALVALAEARALRGEHDAALGLHRRAVAIWEHALDPDHPAVADVLDLEAAQLARMGRSDEASAVTARAAAIRERHAAAQAAINSPLGGAPPPTTPPTGTAAR